MFLDEVKSIHSPSWDSLFETRISHGSSALAISLNRCSATLAAVPLHRIDCLCSPNPYLLNLLLRQPHDILVPLDQLCRTLFPAAFPQCNFPIPGSACTGDITGCGVEGWHSRIGEEEVAGGERDEEAGCEMVEGRVR